MRGRPAAGRWGAALSGCRCSCRCRCLGRRSRYPFWILFLSARDRPFTGRYTAPALSVSTLVSTVRYWSPMSARRRCVRSSGPAQSRGFRLEGVKLPTLTLLTRIAVGETVGHLCGRVVGRTVRNISQHPEQCAGDTNRTGVAQRRTRPALIINFGRALRAEREVMRSPQVRVHPQLTVDESRDRFDGQMLGGTELAWRADGRITLRGELCREPGERAAEHMSSVGHHQLLSLPPTYRM